jgi:aryl-alcohol dehydrogenase-like predicted oxidoreductase
MHYRDLGRTGYRVSDISLGCNRLGEEIHSWSHWVGLVHRALDLGITLFDTSDQYQETRSESVLGEALRSRDEAIVATKAWGKEKRDFTGAGIVRSCEASLKRLCRERIDIYQLHNPNIDELKRDDWMVGLEQLLKAGKIHFAAVSLQTPEDGLWLLENHPFVRVFQVTFNLFETGAEKQFFDQAKVAGAGILVRMPLARGLLSGKIASEEQVRGSDHRLRLDAAKLPQRLPFAKQVEKSATHYAGGLTRMALHFSLTPSAVSCIIPGARNRQQLEENVRASGGRLSAPWRERIDRILNSSRDPEFG